MLQIFLKCAEIDSYHFCYTYRQTDICIYIYARALRLCSCRRKISQLIEYLKLPNRNFKFITQCTGSAESWSRADQARSQHTHTTNCRQPVQWSVHSTAITFSMCGCLTLSPLLSLSRWCSWFGIKCHLIAI